MKIFKFFVFVALLVPIAASAQIGYDEYNKYWYYRHRLTTEFMVLGEGDHGCFVVADGIPYGYSLPAEYTYGGTNTHGFDGDKMMRFADATSYLGYYLGVLATEHKLLKDAGWSTQQTDKELFFAMKAFERLEKYSALWYHNKGFCYENGYFVRDDVEERIFGENPVFERYKVGGEYNYISDYIDSRDNRTSISDKATITQDQLSHLFEGLALVKKCLGVDENYNGYFFRSEAIKQVELIVEKLKRDKWHVKDDFGNRPKHSKMFRNEGHAILSAFAASYFTGKNPLSYLNSVSGFRLGVIRGYLDGTFQGMIHRKLDDVKRDFTYTHITSAFAIGTVDGRTRTEGLLLAMDDRYDLGYYTLLYNHLNNKDLFISGTKWENELENAPCYGITWRPANSSINSSHGYYNGNPGWRARNRWIRFHERDGHTEFPHFKGNGLDYMILYNLYLLHFKSKNPALVGDLPYNPPAHYLSLDVSNNALAYDLESYNTITLSSPINFSNTNVRYITANDQVSLKNGFSFKADNNKTLIISVRGKVNACGHPLDEFGEPIGNLPVLRVSQNEEPKPDRNTSLREERKEETLKVFEPEPYKLLEEYLVERNGYNPTEEKFTASLYPNPTKDAFWLTLKSSERQKINVSMYNSSGRIIYDFGDFDINQSYQDIKLDVGKKVDPGIYFVNVTSTKNKIVLKQIII